MVLLYLKEIECSAVVVLDEEEEEVLETKQENVLETSKDTFIKMEVSKGTSEEQANQLWQDMHSKQKTPREMFNEKQFNTQLKKLTLLKGILRNYVYIRLLKTLQPANHL